MAVPVIQPTGKADSLFQDAKKFFEQARYDDALHALDESIQHQPSAMAWRIKGYIHKMQGRMEMAVQCLEQALHINPKDQSCFSLLAEISVAQGDHVQAAGFYILAIEAAPQNMAYKENFLILAGKTPYLKYNAKAADALVACLQTPGLECAHAQILWLSLFETSPGINKFYKPRMEGTLPGLDPSGFKNGADLSAIDTPLFIEGIKNIAVHFPTFEKFLTQLRRHLLLSVGADKFKAQHLRLAAALGHYTFFTEYIFECSAEEQAEIEKLKSHLQSGKQGQAAALCLYACYAPLTSLDDIAAIAAALAATNEETVQSLAHLQITEAMELEAHKKNIERLTDIDDEVSNRVRTQYEEFPYPRWKNLNKQQIHEDLIKTQGHDGKIRILVAGCGTGREALSAAIAFPNADILAVDLSLTSLSYARNRAKMHGITNVTFKQADILKLGQIQDKFDYITSSGVLHHLADPEAGWKILRGLLKPHGFMRIALYSELGRFAVVAGRKAIQEKGYTDDAAGMRRFRKDMGQLLSLEEQMDLISFGDFYHLSMFRDLLFHVQEHRFDIPRIARALDDNNLRFLKMEASEEAEALYRKSFGTTPQNLANWEMLEKQNPSIFRTMYFIWSQAQ